jgi:hypothetical protein
VPDSGKPADVEWVSVWTRTLRLGAVDSRGGNTGLIEISAISKAVNQENPGNPQVHNYSPAFLEMPWPLDLAPH